MASKIKGGYYIKARKIQNSEIAIAPPHVREIWDWLIKEANHKDANINGTIIKRGSLIRTYNDIREGLHWMVGYRKMMYSKWQCEIAMKWLTKHTMITTTKTTRGLHITICNYDKYQNPKNYENHNENDNETTREPQGTDTINKNEKNDKEKEKENKEKELLSELSKFGKEIFDDIIQFYGLNEINNPLIYIRAGMFVRWLQKEKRLKYFAEQFEAYKWYKEKSGETIHSIESYLSFFNPEEGAWCNNWVKKAEQFAEFKGITGKYYKLKR